MTFCQRTAVRTAGSEVNMKPVIAPARSEYATALVFATPGALVALSASPRMVLKREATANSTSWSAPRITRAAGAAVPAGTAEKSMTPRGEHKQDGHADERRHSCCDATYAPDPPRSVTDRHVQGHTPYKDVGNAPHPNHPPSKVRYTPEHYHTCGELETKKPAADDASGLGFAFHSVVGKQQQLPL